MRKTKYASLLQRSVKEFAINCTVRRALRQWPGFLKDGPGLVVLIAPSGHHPSEYVPSIVNELCPEDRHFRANEVGYMVADATDKPNNVISRFNAECADSVRSVIIADSRDRLPPRVFLAADCVVDIPKISARDLKAACRVNLKMRITDQQAIAALQYPPDLLWTAFRRGRTLQQALKRLRQHPAAEDEAARKEANDVPALEVMYGYGPAKDWGMELAQDLAEWQAGEISWDDVDKGVLLSGPPGVGKTIFAKAVAKQCGVNLVAASLGQWQAGGHLGDLLKAMRLDFARARDAAPSILFIDEIDSVGDRNKFRHDNADYSIQVVNALLECLDGLGGREGVVVIGATNNPDRIDPAVRRAGRLDQHVHIPLPSAEDRIAILSMHLGGLLGKHELEELKGVTSGMTGADLAKVARDAKRLARRNRRPLTIEDLKGSLPQIIPITGEHRRAIAIHEAGHTLVGLRLKHGIYRGTRIVNHVIANAATQEGGAAYFELPRIARRDRKFYLDYIAVLLAGIAAEEVCLGDISDGAGAGETSDLAVATRLATLMETRMGMGESLQYSSAQDDDELAKLRLADPSLRARVDKVLAEQLERAKSLIETDRDFMEMLAATLAEQGVLTDASVAKLADLHSKKASQKGRAA